MKNLLAISLLCLSSTALANFEKVQSCLNQKYAKLSNREAIAAAVVSIDQQKIMTFGKATDDSIFEIGSLTKTFTGLLLANAVNAGSVQIDDQVPAEYQKSEGVITYRGLTTHSSGLIGGNFPDYVSPNDQSPYDGITLPLFKELYAQTPLVYTPGTEWVYSNVGSALLGIILSETAQMSYEELVLKTILTPLEMHDSHFEIPLLAQDRFLQGYVRLGDDLMPFSHWDLFKTAINPAGGLRSTIKDMVKYARAQLVPETSSLEKSIELSHVELFQNTNMNVNMGMNWILVPEKKLIWHNGSTIGFNSILVISKKSNLAVVAMTNTGVYKMNSSGEPESDDSLQNIAFECIDYQ